MTSPNTNNCKTMKLDLAYDTAHQEKENLKEGGSEWDHSKSVSLGGEKNSKKLQNKRSRKKSILNPHPQAPLCPKSSKENIDPKSDFNDGGKGNTIKAGYCFQPKPGRKADKLKLVKGM